MLTLQVKDFGPIVEGKAELKPFTVFIGPNNSGKSYLAILAYCLFHRTGPFPTFRFDLFNVRWELPFHVRKPEKETEDPFNSLRVWLEQRSEKVKEGELSVKIIELPTHVKDFLEKTAGSFFTEAESFSEELQRCYSSGIADLVRKWPEVVSFRILLQQEHPQWRVGFHSSDNELKEETRKFDISPISFSFPIKKRSLLRRGVEERLIPDLLNRFLLELYKDFPPTAYYLPAARSGLIHHHRALVGLTWRRLPLVGIERFEIPKFSGVVADFMSNLLMLEKERRWRRSEELPKVAKFFTQEVLKGDIEVEVGKIEYPEIYYKSEFGKFPLHRTSSMVSELAPLVLFLRYVIEPGDFLIIEEPESHLHPGAQEILARGLVKLRRAGVKILITTHSDYLVGKLNNFIRLSQTSSQVRTKKGYDEDDYLKPEEVGGYLFDWDDEKGGSIVKELDVTPEDGITEEEFAKVAEALGNEAAYLERHIPQRTS